MAYVWYEWIKDPANPKKKQPYFIRLKSQAAVLFAALAQVQAGLELHESDGFVTITAASDQEMVDIHDRRSDDLTYGHTPLNGLIHRLSVNELKSWFWNAANQLKRLSGTQ